jgi:hypothetical protein
MVKLESRLADAQLPAGTYRKYPRVAGVRAARGTPSHTWPACMHVRSLAARHGEGNFRCNAGKHIEKLPASSADLLSPRFSFSFLTSWANGPAKHALGTDVSPSQ